MPYVWLATRLAAMFASPAGRVSRGLALRDRAVRVALLIDLTRQGRLAMGSEEIWIDTGSSGFTPADALLTRIDRHPDESLERLLIRGRVDAVDVLDPDFRPGRILRRRRVKVDAERASADRDRILAVVAGTPPDDEDEAILALIVGSIEVDDRALSDDARDALLRRCGRCAEFVRDCCAFLVRSAEGYSWVRAASSGGGG